MDLSPIFLSLQAASAGTALAFLPGLAAALALARWRSAFKPLLDAAVTVPLVLPPLCIGYLLLLLFGQHGPLGRFLLLFGWELPFTRAAAALAAAAVSFPLMVRGMQVAFESVDPRLEEAARTLGAGELDVFLSVTLPLSARGVAAGCLLSFARGLGEFAATMIFAGDIPGRTRTLPLAMFHHFNMPGGQPEVNFLMGVSVALSLAAILGVQWLGRRR